MSLPFIKVPDGDLINLDHVFKITAFGFIVQIVIIIRKRNAISFQRCPLPGDQKNIANLLRIR